MKIKISSFGCRLNKSEIDSISTMLQQRGHEIVAGDDAHVHIINSCAVTSKSESKVRRLIMHGQKSSGIHTGRMTIVTGCFTEMVNTCDDVVYVSNDYKHMIPDIIEGTRETSEMTAERASRFDYSPPTKAGTTRVNLKIQDGCANNCSYCIIPHVRGVPQSKTIDAVCSEFSSLLRAGFKEILLSGVMIGNYMSEGNDLAGILEKLLKHEGDFRLHLSSLSPWSVTPRLVDLLTHEKTVKHLNLSLQSGSNSILKRMDRRYTRDEYRAITEHIKKRVPLFNFTTDIIVGFPDETETDFNDTLGLIKDVGFSNIHIFRYSPRPGTPAAVFGDTVPEVTKKERSERVAALLMKHKDEYYKKFDGMQATFLSEKARRGKTPGFNEYYVPCEVEAPLERNRFYQVVSKWTQGKSVLSCRLP